MSDNNDGLEALAHIVDTAEIVDIEAAREAQAGENKPQTGPDQDNPAAERASGENSGDGAPPQPKDKYGLPEGCPIVPLGKMGMSYFYLDAVNQLIKLSAKDHSRHNLVGAFSPYSKLARELWPRKKENPDTGEWKITGFKAEDCADDLMDACGRLGVWDPTKRVRERGAWLDDDGSLIFHCGNVLWTKEGEIKPTKLGQYIYPTSDALPTPPREPEPCAAEGGAGQEILDILKKWNWERSEHNIDALLMLGWIACAMVGGALVWRPMAFLTGDRETGKSTLLKKVVVELFNGGIISTADTTARGLAQHIGLSSLPCAVDELENSADSRKQTAIIEFARQAASGDVQLRGTADHGGVSFQARSCFLFSAILMPPLEAQDRSRMAILRVNPFKKGLTPPVLEPRHMRDLGRRLMRRMFDQWPRYEETEFAYKRTLAKAGHSNRACDQFGALLAGADMLLYDDPPDADTLAEWAERLPPKALREIADNKTNAELCLDYMAQSLPDFWKGGSKKTVAELVELIVNGRTCEPESTKFSSDGLAAGGLRVVKPRGGDQQYLAVPHNHRQVTQIFEGSNWQGSPGGGGVWSEALSRLEGVITSSKQRIAGRVTPCTLVPVELVADFGKGEEDGAEAEKETVDEEVGY